MSYIKSSALPEISILENNLEDNMSNDKFSNLKDLEKFYYEILQIFEYYKEAVEEQKHSTSALSAPLPQ